MTTYYTYQAKDLSDSLQACFSADSQYQELFSLDQVPRQLETPAILFLDAGNPGVSAIVSRVQDIQPLLCPVLLFRRQDKPINDPVLQCKTEFLSVEAPSCEVQNRIHRALLYAKNQMGAQDNNQQDSLCNLYSYGYFLQRLKEEIALSKRYQSPVSCVIFRFAFYDAYLDSYGYEFVRQIWQRLTEVIENSIRQEDIAARLGNDEIGLLLPRSTDQGAAIVAERLLEKLNALHIESLGVDILNAQNNSLQDETLEFYAGIVTTPSLEVQDSHPDAILRFARHALHHARSNDAPNNLGLFSDLKPNLLS